MDFRLILAAAVCFPCLLTAAIPPATAPSTAPAAESKEVEKDNAVVTVLLTETRVSTDQQPEFIVRFRNVGKEQYRNLYDVGAYWNWTIEWTDLDPHAASPGPWRLHMNSPTTFNREACGRTASTRKSICQRTPSPRM